jgi:choline dehydrogenase-like flavoprotein
MEIVIFIFENFDYKNYENSIVIRNPFYKEISYFSYDTLKIIFRLDGLSYNPVKDEGIFSLMTFLCGPQARGTVRLSSNDPTSKPIIDHAYLDNDLDVAVLAEGCRLGHEVVMKGRGTKDIITGAWPKTSTHPTDMTAWKEHVRAATSTGYHASGTCKMAPESDPMGVVDSRLRVRGVAGLRVADVSILPILNNGHTQSPAYAIGEKVADMIFQDADAQK